MFDEQGNPLKKPERLPPPPIPTGIINAMAGAKESVKEALGMYNASVGNRSNETSGVAINARKVEGEVATYHFADNRNKAIEQVGRILISAIPEIYDTDRVIRIIGDEENPITVGINGAPMQERQDALYDLRTGQYDVRVTTGASFTTKRQEAAALLGDALKANPALMGVMGDLYFKNLDVAGADAIAARVRKTIPKELIADEETEKGEQPIDPEKEMLAQQLEQLSMQMQQMGAELQSKQADTQLKQAELAIKQEEINIKKGELELKSIELQKEPTPVIDMHEQNIAEREMTLKEAEFQLKALQAAKAEKQNINPSNEADMGMNESIQVLQAKIQKIMEEEQANADRVAQEQAAIEAKRQEEEMEKQIKAQQTQAVIEALSSISNQLNQLTAQVSQPITVVRDENGAITGAV
jgi:hypothetical protein